MNIEIIEAIEEENILMKTIRIPKNMMTLSDKLPKSNYNEKNRKNSEMKSLSDSKAKPNKSNGSSEIIKESKEGELRLDIKQAKNRNESCISNYVNSLVNPSNNIKEDDIIHHSPNESTKIERDEEKKEQKSSLDYIKYIQEKINARKELKIKNIILGKKPTNPLNSKEEKVLKRREEIYRLYLRDLLNGRNKSPYLINSERGLKSKRNQINNNNMNNNRASLPVLPTKSIRNNDEVQANQKYNLNEILHRRLAILGISPDLTRRKEIIVKKPHKYS